MLPSWGVMQIARCLDPLLFYDQRDREDVALCSVGCCITVWMVNHDVEMENWGSIETWDTLTMSWSSCFA